MKFACRVVVVAVAVGATLCGIAQAAPRTQSQPPAAQPPAQTPPPATDPQKPDEPPKFADTVVVTGSKGDEKMIDATATMSVITSLSIESAPSANFAELLRSIPGVNITQVSARDINVTSRAATGTLATGQMALLDGRTLYQDFFGFVMWDFLPVNFNEVKQIEVIRGPASAVWGANALYGVVNVISKTPRELKGTSATFGFGGFDRPDADAGSLWYLSGTYADAPNDRWSYKLSGGGYSQDALARPTGLVPCDNSSVCSGTKAPYPPFANTGTTQPKFDARVDYDYEDGKTLSFSGGVAGTDGIMHSGIGPFDINSGSVMSYAKANFTKGALRAGFFTNLLRGDADQLLTRGLNGAPIEFVFDTTTVDFDLSNVQTFAKRHVVSYGGNLRFNSNDLSIAPNADNRTEFGIYGQDEIFLSDHFRLVAGGRMDRFDFVDNFVFSPRVAFLMKPDTNQTFRVSYNKAYRSPSVINNFIDLIISQPVNLSALGVRTCTAPGQHRRQHRPRSAVARRLRDRILGRRGERPRDSVGGVLHELVEERHPVHAADRSGVHRGQPALELAAATRRPRAPRPAEHLPAVALHVSEFRQEHEPGNRARRERVLNRYTSLFANYSYQSDPDPKDFPLSELNLPPNNRFNIGASFTYNKFLGNISVAYTDEAFWQDVLNDPYHGTTEPYTLVNAGFGFRWLDDKVTTSLKVVNLANSSVQQHVFGDVTKFQMVGEIKVQFPR